MVASGAGVSGELNARASAALLAKLRALPPLVRSTPAAPAAPASSRAERRANDRRVLAHGEEGSAVRARRRPLVPRSSRLPAVDWTREDFARARRVSASGSRARDALMRLPRCYAQRIERAALAMRPELGPDGKPTGRRVPTRGWGHVVARRIAAVACVMFHAARPSRRRGMARIVVGRTRGMFVTLFRGEGRARDDERQRARLSVSTFFATSHHGTDDPWDCGAVVALHRAGALWRHQPPASCAGPWKGKDRDGRPRAFNEYHLTQRACSAETDDVRPLVDWELPELAVDVAPVRELATRDGPP
jgi:hypothetical protein